MGCNGERESSLGPFVGNEEGGQDEVERRMMTRMKRDENEGDPEDSVIEGGQGG